MWAILSSPGHADAFADYGQEYAPMCQLVATLSKQSYADDFYAFNSLATFCITSATSYAERDGHDSVLIQFNPEMGLFSVKYAEWVSPTRNPPYRIAASRTSGSESDVLEIVNRYVLRLQIASRLQKP